ncbi:hypothetical protein HID58_048772 [Brassica napus]|uniref:TIR domain-containing protein n=1 Tax=Brassica napus TaxID=3708 RepID=A0ABQ8B322_BRANA|nr:hypothetical protein HID58_048772 [Brassica napus]
MSVHFLKELDQKLIIAFKDSETERSRSLVPELKQAIRDSRIAVVIFSKRYASSSWCLNEFLEIVKCKEECGQMVIPFFYGLDPSHVRKQIGDFGKIFEETCHKKTEEVKIRWSEALTNVDNTLGLHTIARVLFTRLSRHFQCSIFIDRAFISKSMEIFYRANPSDYNMKLHLQRNFLSEILGKGDIKVNHLSAIEERLKHQKVLILIDDFDDQVVLDALIGQAQWFGSGSRIIVGHGIDHVYEVCLPSEKLAIEMLCRSAFRKNATPEGFKEIVVKVTGLAGSLPLGLCVLGSSLQGRDKEYWMDLLPNFQNGIDGKIEKSLRVSYDGLSSKGYKAIFRHIACLFNDSGLSVNVGMENLADKSLIHVSRGRVEMHRLLQEMGRSIVRREEPEKREFLVDSQDICDVFSEGIVSYLLYSCSFQS